MKFVKSGAKRRRHKKNPAKSKARRTTRRARHNGKPLIQPDLSVATLLEIPQRLSQLD